jgi:aspartate/methionine/tyrosine aminotransferase
VLIIDGLTKRFRLPGWRVAWIIGPKEFIKALVLPALPAPNHHQ